MKYKKKPVVIEAVQWQGRKIICPPGPEWFAEADESGKFQLACSISSLSGDILLIHTLEGVMRANVGDYIIQGIKGEIYPCNPDIFAATYEAVE